MGMSASQVRFLSLQNRKHTIGNELSTLTNRKMALSRDMNKISKNYTNALNQNILRWSNDSGATYQDLSFDIMMKPNDLNSETPYIVTTRDGRAVLDSVQNLIGYDSSTGKYVTLADAKISGSGIPSIEGSDLTYENIAKWISESRDKSGKKGNLYTTTDGYSAGTGSGAYVIPDGPLSYGFENALRYQIFENLGLVDQGTANEYLLMVNGKYGSEAAENFGNYEELLRQFIYQYTTEGGAAYTTGNTVKFNPGIRGANDYPFIFDDDTKIGMIGGMAVSGDESCFGKYFGKIDNTTGKFIGGSLEGNIALAKLALTEYDTWCKQLKEFNLASPTTFVFEATSGRTLTTTVNNLLQFNSTSSKNNNGAEIISNNISGTENTTVYTALKDSFGGTLVTTERSWEELYNNKTYDSIVKLESSIEPTTKEGYKKYDVVAEFINALAGAFYEGSDAATSTGSDGDQWTLNFMVEGMDVDPTLMVDDGKGGKISITQAAAQYAANQTANYYNSLTAAQGDWRECTDGWCPWPMSNCYTTSNAWGEARAASYNNSEQYNGLGQAYSDECGWHSFTNFVGGMFEMLAGVVTYTFSGGNSHVFLDGVNTWADSMDAGQFRTLDLRNIEKSYFTYYEIFMKEALQNNRNLLTNSSTTVATSYNPVNDIMSRLNPLIGTANLVTDGVYQRTTRVNPTSCPSGCNPSYGSGGAFLGYTNSDGYLVYNWSYQAPKKNADGTYVTDAHGNIVYETKYLTNSTGQKKALADTVKANDHGNMSVGYYTNGGAYYYSGAYNYTVTQEDLDSGKIKDKNVGDVIQVPASQVANAKYTFSGAYQLVDTAGTRTETNSGYYITEVQDDDPSQVRTTYYFNTPITYYGSTFNKIVQDANGTIHYFNNGLELSESQKPRYEVKQPQTEFSDGTTTLKVALNDTQHTGKIHAFISPDEKFMNDLKEDVRRAEEALLNYNELMKNFFTQKETKLMDYYDAIFLKISKDGWVCDPHINEKDNEQKAKNYLNNKLQNYDYYVAECKEKADLAGYNYLPKLAVNVRKIFQCHDTSSENQALATYEAEKTLIQSKEKKIDARIQKLETEQQVINTELDNVQKVMKENIDKTFKMFA